MKAAVLREVGTGVTSLHVGDHVVVSWVAPCRRCFSCLAGHPELCEHGMDHAVAGPYGTPEPHRAPRPDPSLMTDTSGSDPAAALFSPSVADEPHPVHRRLRQADWLPLEFDPA